MILVDTHVVAWLALDPQRLSGEAKVAREQARNSGHGLAISDITIFELAALAGKGCIRLDASLESFLQGVETRFIVFPSPPVPAPLHMPSL